MSPAIRLGGRNEPWQARRPVGRLPKLRQSRLELDGIPTRSLSSRGKGVPTVLLHGWIDSADTWRATLDRMARRGSPAIAYDLPGFGVTPPLGDEDPFTSLESFAAAAIRLAAEEAGRDVVLAGNSLGGWLALRMATRPKLPIAGVVAMAPAGIAMAPMFFAIDRVPGIDLIVGAPPPVPRAVVRGVVGRLYRRLAFADGAAVEQIVVDRFTRYNGDRATMRRRIDYAKRLRVHLDDPFDPRKIKVPVTAIWGEKDRLCLPSGAERLAEMLPEAKLIMVPDCGHSPQIEETELVVRELVAIADQRKTKR